MQAPDGVSAVSDRIPEMTERAGGELASRLVANAASVMMGDRGDRAAFESRLHARWGSALEMFDLICHESRELGSSVNTTYRPEAARRQDHKFEALIRLHGKAVMTAGEVLVLLSAGYSTGALARWRTLHETWIVFALLDGSDTDISRRYLAHSATEAMRGQDDYDEIWQRLGSEPPEMGAVERAALRAKLTSEFGSEFLKPYGWAAPLFDDGKAPRLKDLQDKAELDHWRGHYRMASHGTHAEPQGIQWSIQTLGDLELVIAGPSNAGLLDPAQCSLIALINVTIELITFVLREFTDDDDQVASLQIQFSILVEQQKLLALLDEAIDRFVAVDEQQKAEEDALLELIDAIVNELARRPDLSPDKIAEALESDTGRVTEALEAGVRRGRFRPETHFTPGGKA